MYRTLPSLRVLGLLHKGEEVLRGLVHLPIYYPVHKGVDPLEGSFKLIIGIEEEGIEELEAEGPKKER